MLEKMVAELKRAANRGLKKEQKEELASAEKVLAWLQAGREIRNGMDEWNLKDVDFLNINQFLSAKPVVYLINLSPADYMRKKNKWLLKISEWVNANGGGKMIPFSGALEAQLVDMPADERAAWITANVGGDSALPKIIKTGACCMRAAAVPKKQRAMRTHALHTHLGGSGPPHARLPRALPAT
jgi:obg-like ATPase 1